MDQKQVEEQAEKPETELSEKSQTPAKAEPASISEKPEKPKPGRFQKILRKVLIWFVVVAFVFMAGLLTDEYLRYRPLAEKIAEVQSALDQANQDISNLQAETARLIAANQAASDKIASLESENGKLQNELDAANAHLELLQVLVDVSGARLALFLDDVQAARAALVDTPQRLDNLLPFIKQSDPNLAQSMPQRLNLIITGLDRDIETVKIDLELFSKDLLQVEATLFPK